MKKEKLFSISLVIIIVLLIIVIGILILKDNKKDLKHKTNINLKSEIASVVKDDTINLRDYLSLENVTFDKLEFSVSDESLAKINGDKVVVSGNKGSFNIIVKYQDIVKEIRVNIEAENVNQNDNLFTKVTYNELNSLLKTKDKFVFVIASHKCSACLYYHGILNQVISDTKATIYYIDLLELTDDEYYSLGDKFPFEYTPTTIFIENGKEISSERLVGAASSKDVIDALKKNEIIK